ncbi:hypothetical protein [Azonexus sp. IMCC34839]|uniref:hypothetical protein n=1 Tax=Azonexus sp. IMCC34839 TaxID=3133695 RepID=UPI00399B1D21
MRHRQIAFNLVRQQAIEIIVAYQQQYCCQHRQSHQRQKGKNPKPEFQRMKPKYASSPGNGFFANDDYSPKSFYFDICIIFLTLNNAPKSPK